MPKRLARLASLVAALGFLSAGSGEAFANSAAPPVDAELRQLLKETIANSDSFVDRFEAEVWLMSKSNRLSRFVKDPEKRLHLLRSVHRAATQAGLQPEVVLAVIEVESAFDRFAISRAGAQGIMQVMPFWKHEIGRPEDNLIDLETNLRYGCTILKYYLDKAEGRIAEALARYNGSYGEYWYPERVMVAWQKNWR
ncbi:lytic transglycosylase domain-containing protein [Proteobacteria bacterium 005FR1]|nr:lytic transglycosylase domain-containing protein [Proteobacteria bacterium 005FR1]